MWLLAGILLSGGSALYWWKKMHPGESLNPMPPSPPSLEEQQEANRRAASPHNS